MSQSKEAVIALAMERKMRAARITKIESGQFVQDESSAMDSAFSDAQTHKIENDKPPK